MTDGHNSNQADSTGGSATSAAAPEILDLAQRLKVIVAELETGVAAEVGELMTPSEKLRAIADLIDRRAATSAPPTPGRATEADGPAPADA